MQDSSSPEFTAVILASTYGARLLPLTKAGSGLNAPSSDNNDYFPKHLLPLAGQPLIHHLLRHLESLSLELVLVVISANDDKTITALEALGAVAGSPQDGVTMLSWKSMTMVVVQMEDSVNGSAEAVRSVSQTKVGESWILPRSSHVLILPGDLILYHPQMISENETERIDTTHEGALIQLANLHRSTAQMMKVVGGCASSTKSSDVRVPPPAAMTILLTNVGDECENGLPLKESTKAKKGGLAREDDADIEYIGLATLPRPKAEPIARLIYKECKYDIEQDEEALETGSTPKIEIPKARLHPPINSVMIASHWSDVFCYCLSPWVVQLLQERVDIMSLNQDLLPLLIAKQFRGVEECFYRGNTVGVGDNVDVEEGSQSVVKSILNSVPFANYLNTVPTNISSRTLSTGVDDDSKGNASANNVPFLVGAHVLNRSLSRLTLRASTIPAYLYANREVAAQAASTTSSLRADLNLPKKSRVDTKFNSITLPDCHLGAKAHAQSSIIGRKVKIGERCRLNNVIVMDNVVIGDNCVLQNSILCENCVIEKNCNLNDCQVGPKVVIKSQTKEKGESFTEDYP